MIEVFETIVKNRGFLAAREDYEEARAAIFGIPMDFTTSFRPGTRLGPQRIREASYSLEEYSFYLNKDLGEKVYCDLGDVALPFGNISTALENIEKAARKVLKDGKIPVAMGGEHLVSLPLIKAAAEQYPGLAVVHFDAHADLREEYLGEIHSHATVMRRVVDIVGGRDVYQFGIRSGTREEFAFAQENTRLYKDEIFPGLKVALQELKGRPVYVTLDIDVLDPAYAPGTGTPEPGGATSREMISAIHLLGEQRVVGFDLVEVSPVLDPSDRTSVLAAKLIREAILSFG